MSDFVGEQSRVHIMPISAKWKHKSSIHICFIVFNGGVTTFFAKSVCVSRNQWVDTSRLSVAYMRQWSTPPFDYVFSSDRRQTIICTNVGLISIRTIGTNFSEIWICIKTFWLTVCKIATFCLVLNVLTHWGRETHICVSKLTIIGSDNGLSPDRRQTIIRTNAGILLNLRTLTTNVSEIVSEIHTFPFKKIHLKISSVKWRPFVSAFMNN